MGLDRETAGILSHLSQSDFEATREYLSKNVYLMTSTQSSQLGYALDSRWHGTAEFTTYMRERLAELTHDEVNAAIRRHFQVDDVQLVYVTKDVDALQQALFGP